MTHQNSHSKKIGCSLITVGRFTYGSDDLNIRQWNEGANLKIGSFCSIGQYVTIFLGGNHRVDWVSTFPFGHVYVDELGGPTVTGHPATKGDVTIGNDVWIGEGATVMSGITIGDGAVIAANSTITKNVAPYSIVGGNPEKFLKYRFDADVIDSLLQLRWWDLPLDSIKSCIKILSAPPDLKVLSELISQFRSEHL
jgi:acetyltransferase-like isoleucine patch superfamily enzyme